VPRLAEQHAEIEGDRIEAAGEDDTGAALRGHRLQAGIIFAIQAGSPHRST
jgi:hypothetical protein